MPQDDVISGVYFEIFTVESNKIPTGTYTYALGDEILEPSAIIQS